MKTALVLVVLSLGAGVLAIRILEIPMRFSRPKLFRRKRPRRLLRKGASSPDDRAEKRQDRPGSGALRRTAHDLARLVRHGPARAERGPRSRVGTQMKAARRIAQPGGPPLIESPSLSQKPASRVQAGSRLVMLIVVYGAGMAIFTLLALRWLAAFLERASS